MDKKTAELLVKIIAILGYIGAALSVIAGIMMFFGGTFFAAYLPGMGEGLFSGAFVGAMLIVTAIIGIVWGIFAFILSLNLWKHKNWARVVLGVFAALGAIGSLFSIVTSPASAIFGLVIQGGIFYLLMLNKDVKKLFK